MGCTSSAEDSVQKEKSKSIDKYLKEEKKVVDKVIKLILLGAGASGKSTLAKQMKIIYLNGFSDEKDRSQYKELIYFAIIKGMKVLVQQAEKFKYEISPNNQQNATTLKELAVQLSSVELSADITESIKQLWTEESIKTTFARGDEYHIDECCGYFFDNLKRISAPKYVPTVDDILRVRVKTTGITETLFGVGNNLKINMVDVGGQRNERKKWIHCFQDTAAIVFVVAISEYNQNTEEDMITNRIDEAIKLFSETINNKFFEKSNIILFLNKKDIFKKKLQKIPLKNYMKDYDEEKMRAKLKQDTSQNTAKLINEMGEDYTAASTFICNKLLACDKSEGKRYIYYHHTCATDTENIRVVWNAVQDIFIQQEFKDVGF